MTKHTNIHPSHIPRADEHTTAQLIVVSDELQGSNVWPALLASWMKLNPISPSQLEIIELPSSEQALSIDDVRALSEQLAYAVAGENYRHVVIHRAETASIPAQQALLKALEDGKDRTQWWLLSSSETAVLPTIQSRCQTLHIRQVLQPADIKNLEQEVTEQLSVDDNAVAALFGNLDSMRPGEIVDLSQQYTNRQTLRRTLKQALSQLHENPSPAAMLDVSAGQVTRKTTSAASAQELAEWGRRLQTTLTCLDMLDANVSPRMVFEHWLFGLTQAGSRTGRKAGSVI